MILYGTGVRASELLGIKRKNIYANQDREGRKVLLINSPNLKHKTKHKKTIPIYAKEESWLVKPIVAYCKKIDDRDQYLFFNFVTGKPFTRQTVFDWSKKYFSINPHGFRKIRLTHLVQEFGFTDRQLVMFAGWSNAQPADAYVSLRFEDIVPERFYARQLRKNREPEVKPKVNRFNKWNKKKSEEAKE